MDEAFNELEGVLRTLTPRRALDVVREVGAWRYIVKPVTVCWGIVVVVGFQLSYKTMTSHG